MNQRKLYIVGNGFDLWHKIPSAFQDFKDFLNKHDRELLTAVEEYLPVEGDWRTLESALAGLDVEHIINTFEYTMTSYNDDDWSDSDHHIFQQEVGQLIEKLSKGLRDRFAQWIRKIPMPTPATASRLLLTLDPTALFLTFNYTSTLRILYGVQDRSVWHIHGKAEDLNSILVLGHAWDPRKRKCLNDHPDVEDFDTRLLEANDIIDNYFGETFKPSARLIQEAGDSFSQLAAIKEVCVLGHSLSAVDELYLHALLAVPAVRAARWQVAYSPEYDDPNERCLRLVELGVSKTRVVASLWSEL
jgi:hypothetical protein